MTTPANYTTRAEAYVATCPSPAVAYAVIAGLILGYSMANVADAAGVSIPVARDCYVKMSRAMSDGLIFTDAAQEALRAALKRRVEV